MNNARMYLARLLIETRNNVQSIYICECRETNTGVKKVDEIREVIHFTLTTSTCHVVHSESVGDLHRHLLSQCLDPRAYFVSHESYTPLNLPKACISVLSSLMEKLPSDSLRGS